ncbi:MAG: signal transduction histidine kinase [Parcubacteria group bacterium Gr01-1014_8]|nr:MAG: signal transduction histidine kinase [Parcubacteria group bacterium Gr01-1014_8]
MPSAERKPKVLMLDDEKLLLDIYKQKFEKGGYEVSMFYTADDALNALRNGYEPDVILFDITIPNSRSGYDFLETLQKDKLSKHSLKVALSNEGQDGERARTAELGADAHLLKANFIPSELVTVVDEMLRKRKKSWWKKQR